MGIKFLCENCEKKIHVKDFLAGKRAKCPHCNTSIRIPDVSSISGDVAQTDHPATDEPAGLEVETASKSEADSRAAVVTKKKDRSRSKHTKADVGPRQEAMSDTKSSSAKSPTVAALAKPENPAPKVEPVVAPVPNPAPVPSAPANDPFADAGDAMWYVAPPSGGQYGPADSKLLQSWIAEGRVSADSLVWREGWTDWKSASVVMQVPDAPAAPPPTTATSEKTATEKAATNGSAATASTTDAKVAPAEKKETAKADKSSVVKYHRAHQRSRGLGIMLIAALAIVSVALVVVLIFVLKMSS